MKKFLYFLKFIAMGSFSLVLTACYGVMYGVPYRVKDVVVKINNSSGIPIPGLAVILRDQENQESQLDEEFSNYYGEAFFELDPVTLSEYRLDIVDIDGFDSLGLYRSKTILINPESLDDDLEIVTEIIEAISKTVTITLKDNSGTLISNLEVDINEILERSETSSVILARSRRYLYSDQNGMVSFVVDADSNGYIITIRDVDNTINDSYGIKTYSLIPESLENESQIEITMDRIN